MSREYQHSESAFAFPRLPLFGLAIDAVTRASAAELVRQWARQRQRRVVTPLNVNLCVKALSDRMFGEAVMSSDLVVADGMPLVWIGNLVHRGDQRLERVNGTNLIEDVLGDESATGLTVVLAGGRPGLAHAAAQALSRRHPHVAPAVGLDMPFGNWPSHVEWARTVLRPLSRRTRIDLLLVGTGAPKQEILLQEIRGFVGFGVAVAVGGAFEFFAGTRTRAPVWVQDSGLEWLFRLTREPIRLSRRYAVDAVGLAYLTARELVRFPRSRGNLP